MNLETKKNEFDKVVEHAHEELNSIRTSRATPSLVENIKIDVYGAQTPLVQVAGITCPEAKQLIIEPWDKNILKDVEKAIDAAGLGLSISNEGNFLRVSMPPMTEETRKEIIKVLHTKIEASRVALRQVRDKIKNEIEAELKNKEITEDDKYSLIEDLDKMTREFTDEIGEIGKKKESEIML